MASAETINAIALSMMFSNRPERLKLVYEQVGSATGIVNAADHLQDIMPDMNVCAFSIDTDKLKQFQDTAQKEAEYLEKHHMECLTPDMEAYPTRLFNACPDAPIALYFCGNANLNATHILSIVGTRDSTEYGRDVVNALCKELSQMIPDLLIVSGLAYGTDVNAHRAALDYNVPTVGVLAHGLDRIYPTVHRNTAARMITQGGLLTEFPANTTPGRFNFLRRNRIIAGLSHGTLVVESKYKGGSLATARLARDYGLRVMACPGRASDSVSEGCNNLIKSNTAAMVTSARDVVQELGWQPVNNLTEALPSLFDVELSTEEQMVFNKLESEGQHINQIVESSGFSISMVMSILSELEFQGLVRQLPGSKWRKIV